MSEPQPTLSLVTLGVGDLARSIAFYEALGFTRKVRGAEGVAFFAAGASAIALWTSEDLAKDARIAAAPLPAFRGVSLGWNCRSEAEADAIVERARRAGAAVPKPPEKTSWGGYAGYFTDPEGYLWEVVYNPDFPLDAAGRLVMPD